ncbi:MAG: rod shape-determining protein MreD [Chloroflexia bacterium]
MTGNLWPAEHWAGGEIRVVYGLTLVALLLALLQVGPMPRLPLLGVRPDLVFLVALAWGMVRGSAEGAVVAFSGGLALDILSSFPLGGQALALLLTVISLAWLGAPFYRGNPLFPVAGAFLGTWVYHLLLLLLAQLFGQAVAWGGALRYIVLPLSLVEAALMLPIYWLLDRLERRMHRRTRAV